jgi:hypothetical protein
LEIARRRIMGTPAGWIGHAGALRRQPPRFFPRLSLP